MEAEQGATVKRASSSSSSSLAAMSVPLNLLKLWKKTCYVVAVDTSAKLQVVAVDTSAKLQVVAVDTSAKLQDQMENRDCT